MDKIQWDLVKIIVADDNRTTLKIFQKAIKKLGCAGAYASNGEEAIHLVRKYRFDLCFMDILMIELGGIEATIIIRENYDSMLPIVGMSAAITDSVKEKCLNIGMDQVLAKPLSIQVIRDTIERYMNKDDTTLTDF